MHTKLFLYVTRLCRQIIFVLIDKNNVRIVIIFLLSSFNNSRNILPNNFKIHYYREINNLYIFCFLVVIIILRIYIYIYIYIYIFIKKYYVYIF